MRLWYYRQDGQQHGPYGEVELTLLFKQNRIPGETLVWTEGMTEWKQADKLKEFRTFLNQGGLNSSWNHEITKDDVIKTTLNLALGVGIVLFLVFIANWLGIKPDSLNIQGVHLRIPFVIK